MTRAARAIPVTLHKKLTIQTYNQIETQTHIRLFCPTGISRKGVFQTSLYGLWKCFSLGLKPTIYCYLVPDPYNIEISYSSEGDEDLSMEERDMDGWIRMDGRRGEEESDEGTNFSWLPGPIEEEKSDEMVLHQL